MEMGAEQLAVRIVGSIGRIDQGHLRTGRLSDDEWPRLTEAIEKMRGVKLHIDETPGLTVGELRANARRLARLNGGKLGLIVVDYLQLMTTSAGSNEESPSWMATCSAMFTAKLVLPILGRAARMIRSPACRPEVMRSKS